MLSDIDNPSEVRDAVHKERARRMEESLERFVRQGAWNVLHPSAELDWNWHHTVICDALEAVTAGEIKRLFINAPPGSMKSLLLDVFWPAWEWTHSPSTQWMTASHAGRLTKRDCMRCRDLVRSPWYSKYWDVEIRHDRDGKTDFGNTDRGFIHATSIGAGATGLRADRLNVDDPIDVEEAYSDKKRQGAIDWFSNKFADRLNSDDSTIVVIGQRVHDADLFDYLHELGSYESIVMTDPYDPDYQSEMTTFDFEDPREEGEYLHPERHGPDHHEEQRKQKGPSIYAAHFGQRPTQPGGEVLKSEWLNNRFREQPAELLSRLRNEYDDVEVVWTCDPKQGSKAAGSSECCIQLWVGVGRDDSNRRKAVFLLDERRGRWNQPETLSKMRELYSDPLWGLADRILVENEADGPSIEANLSPEFSTPIELVKPWAGKKQRTEDVTGYWEAGVVHLPSHDMDEYDWIESWVSQHVKFPKGANDDRVDASTYALWYFCRYAMEQGADGWHAAGESDYEEDNDETQTLNAEVRKDEDGWLSPDDADEDLELEDEISRF